MKRVLVPLAPGFEDVEAITVIDYLRRAGAHVVTAAVGGDNPITSKQKVRVFADTTLEAAIAEAHGEFAAVVLPGGPGVARLVESEPLLALLCRRFVDKALTAAICAAPIVLARAGLDHATRLTSWPGTRPQLASYAYLEDRVVRDGHIITSRGPGTAVAFALTLIEALYGADKASEIADDTVS